MIPTNPASTQIHVDPVAPRARRGQDATEAFNSVAGQIAISEIDTRRQSLGQPTLAQEAQKHMGSGPYAPCGR